MNEWQVKDSGDEICITNPVGHCRKMGTQQFKSSLLRLNQLEQLRFLLEDYPKNPYGWYQKQARALLQQLPIWTSQLGHAVFDTRAPDILANEQMPTLKLLSTTGDLLSQPWELLENNGKHSVQVVRQHFQSQNASLTYPSRRAADLRVLWVVSRPNGIHDVSYSIVLRAAIERLRANGVLVEILRPATAEQFRSCLTRFAKSPFDILHLDMHGTVNPENIGLLEWEDAFSPLSPLGKTTCASQSIETLLTRVDVPLPPLVVLNACRSGYANFGVKTSSSVALQLLEHGVQCVVGMSYNVRPEIASVFMASFYSQLLTGASIGDGVSAARQFLLKHPPERSPDVAGWVLPALYGNPSFCLVKHQPFLTRSVSITPVPKDIPENLDDGLLVVFEKWLGRQLAISGPGTPLILFGGEGIGKSLFISGWSQLLHATSSEIGEINRICLNEATFAKQESQLQSWVHTPPAVIDASDITPLRLLIIEQSDWLEDCSQHFRDRFNALISAMHNVGVAIVITGRTSKQWLNCENCLRVAFESTSTVVSRKRERRETNDTHGWYSHPLVSLKLNGETTDHRLLRQIDSLCNTPDLPALLSPAGNRPVANLLKHAASRLDSRLSLLSNEERHLLCIFSVMQDPVDFGKADQNCNDTSDTVAPLIVEYAHLSGIASWQCELSFWKDTFNHATALCILREENEQIYVPHPLLGALLADKWPLARSLEMATDGFLEAVTNAIGSRFPKRIEPSGIAILVDRYPRTAFHLFCHTLVQENFQMACQLFWKLDTCYYSATQTKPRQLLVDMALAATSPANHLAQRAMPHRRVLRFSAIVRAIDIILADFACTKKPQLIRDARNLLDELNNMAQAQVEMAILRQKQGDWFRHQTDYTNASKCYAAANCLYIDVQDTEGQAEATHSMAMLFFRNNHAMKARQYLIHEAGLILGVPHLHTGSNPIGDMPVSLNPQMDRCFTELMRIALILGNWDEYDLLEQKLFQQKQMEKKQAFRTESRSQLDKAKQSFVDTLVLRNDERSDNKRRLLHEVVTTGIAAGNQQQICLGYLGLGRIAEVEGNFEEALCWYECALMAAGTEESQMIKGLIEEMKKKL
ncbi:MAG: CHAT domain-containing protein [Deltaproteobacteria bacterium]|nr:CHAT domain-containing protein [Deltaproteobacteria bacterium]